MPTRLPHPDPAIIAGQQSSTNYLKMQKLLGRFYLNKFFEILAEQNKTGRFLEIGCGSGFQTAEVAGKYPLAEIVAVEPSADMIAVATGYLIKRGLKGRVQFFQSSVEDETLIRGLGEFDLVYSTFSLHHWSDPGRAFRNLYGALAPAGVLLIYDFQRDWLACRLPLTRGMVESIRASYTPQEIQALIAQASVPIYRVRSSFPYLSIEITRPDEPVFSKDPDTIKRLDELERGQEGRNEVATAIYVQTV